MKKVKFIIAAICSLFILVACEKKDEVKVESLTNTYWEYAVNEYHYMKVWFYDSSKGKIEMRTSKSDDIISENVGYSVKQSGYVSITMFPGTSLEREWIYGNFDKDKCTLTLGSMKMTYKGKAK